MAVALHAGHALRSELRDYITLSDTDRLREEDPFTAAMAPAGVTVLEALRSRFEVDLNRPRERAVYRGADDAWGLELFSSTPPIEIEEGSLRVYDRFYDLAHEMLSEAEQKHGRFVVLDLHSYNHRRGGAALPPAPVKQNPEVNLGTSRFDRHSWAPVVESFVHRMSESGFDCRENVRFRGGHFSQWVADTFPETGVALAVEFKKTYIDEWTGCADKAAIERIQRALHMIADDIEHVLTRMT